MNTVISSFFIVSPFIVAILAAFAFVLFAIAALVKPRLLAYPYLGLLFTVTGSSYGRLDTVLPSIYNRGVGVLYFALSLWLVLIAYIWSRVSSTFTKTEALPCNLYPWFLGWFFLLAAHAAVAFYLQVPIKDAISPMGFSNIMWMAVLILLLLSVFKTPVEVEELTRLIVLVGIARAAYGLIRWVAFSGDPANAYANFGQVNIKLTFFDINDSLVCMLAFSIAAIRLFRTETINQGKMWQMIYWIAIITTLACIIFSFRRTAWLGFLLGAIIILSQMPTKRRIQAALLAGPIVVSAIAYSAWNRLSQTKGAGGLEYFFYDVNSKSIGAETERLLELKLAWADFLDNFLLGIGSWAGYAGHQLISWQNQDAGRYLHSGILHVALKTGIVGLTLLVGLYVSYALFVRRAATSISELHRPLFFAGAVGVAFMLPDMVIGTPIPQIRTTQMLAVCFALPYLAYGISQRFGGAKSAPVSASKAHYRFSHRVSSVWGDS